MSIRVKFEGGPADGVVQEYPSINQALPSLYWHRDEPTELPRAVSVEEVGVVEDAAAAVGTSTAVGPVCADPAEVAAALPVDLHELPRYVVTSVRARAPEPGRFAGSLGRSVPEVAVQFRDARGCGRPGMRRTASRREAAPRTSMIKMNFR